MISFREHIEWIKRALVRGTVVPQTQPLSINQSINQLINILLNRGPRFRSQKLFLPSAREPKMTFWGDAPALTGLCNTEHLTP